MGLFRNLFRVTKSRNRDLSRPTEEPCLCSGCGNALPSIMSKIVDAETISCPMCTKKHKLLDDRYPEYDEFEVLVYALPWNPCNTGLRLSRTIMAPDVSGRYTRVNSWKVRPSGWNTPNPYFCNNYTSNIRTWEFYILQWQASTHRTSKTGEFVVCVCTKTNRLVVRYRLKEVRHFLIIFVGFVWHDELFPLFLSLCWCS